MRLILLWSLIVVLGGCSGPRRMSAAKFQENYAQVSSVNTISSTTYLGQRDGRAMLRIGSMNLITQRWSEQDYYVDLDELDPEFRKTLPIDGFSLEDALLRERERRLQEEQARPAAATAPEA